MIINFAVKWLHYKTNILLECDDFVLHSIFLDGGQCQMSWSICEMTPLEGSGNMPPQENFEDLENFAH